MSTRREAAMTEYPTELDECITLANDQRVRIRALRPCEDGSIREFYARLSARTRYLRFFSPMPSLPDSVMRMLTCADYGRCLALVAEHVTSSGREIIGLGSYNAIDDQHAEVALVVRDDWQRQRVGTTLADRVLQAAERRGFHRFTALVHSDNRAIRRLLRNIGDVVSATIDGTLSELVFVRRHS
jgi:RimJ/RimL family protein N-acetyltransferase